MTTKTPKRIETLLAKLASGELDYQDSCVLLSKAARAIDKTWSGPITEEEHDAYRALRARMFEAREVGTKNRQARLEAACVAARQAERDARPLPGTYAHEMALMRAGLI